MSKKRITQLASVLTIIAAIASSPRTAQAGIEVYCGSGGQGASSCSIGSCSVSCNSGYYACCSGAGCRCIPV